MYEHYNQHDVDALNFFNFLVEKRKNKRLIQQI